MPDLVEGRRGPSPSLMGITSRGGGRGSGGGASCRTRVLFGTTRRGIVPSPLGARGVEVAVTGVAAVSRIEGTARGVSNGFGDAERFGWRKLENIDQVLGKISLSWRGKWKNQANDVRRR